MWSAKAYDVPSRRPLWQLAAVLLGAPCLQVTLFLASGLTFAEHSKYAFITGMVTLYVFLALVLWFMRRSGMHLSDLGLVAARWRREILVGVSAGFLLFVLAGLLAVGLERVLPSVDLREERPLWAAVLFGIALVTAFAPIEEFIWRGYAITVLREQIGKPYLAVIIASLASGLMHWWGGIAYVVASTIMGVAFSVLYLWRKSLVANILAHFLVDLPVLLFMLLGVSPP